MAKRKKTSRKRKKQPPKDRDVNLEELKHMRVGHVDSGRLGDALVAEATRLLPGTGVLPTRWKYVSLESFNRRYTEDLGPLVWAKTASYHMLLINGHYAFRIWTDAQETVLCDVSEDFSKQLCAVFDVFDIPKASLKKCQPFTKRFNLTSEKDVQLLLLHTVKMHGLF